MAIFTNQATLTYNGSSTNSNIAVGELLDVLVATKTAVEGSYTPGQPVTYVVTLRNTGNAPLTGLVITDNLGGYDFNGTTVYPLTYEDGSVALFTDGVPQAAPTVVAGPPLVFSDITVPAGGDVVIVYQAQVNAFANPAVGGTIDNTVTVTGDGLSAMGGVLNMTKDIVNPIIGQISDIGKQAVETPVQASMPQTNLVSAWNCTCGQSEITSNFCPNCGARKPETNTSWNCPNCGQAGITSNFCPNCGSKKG